MNARYMSHIVLQVKEEIGNRGLLSTYWRVKAIDEEDDVLIM